jgi:DNA polymerase-3 subunit epsilon
MGAAFTVIFSKKLVGHWRSYDFCAVDVETTGLDLKKDEVISVGAVTIHDGRFKGDGNLYAEIIPSQSPSPASITIHGLRDIDLSTARAAEDVIPELITFMSAKYLIAHASWVEKAFLAHRLKKYGQRYPKEVIDTAALARFAGYAEAGIGHEPSLEFLARKLNLPVYTPHHALGDAMTTAAVFVALCSRIEHNQLAESGKVLSLQQLLDISKS